MVSRDHQSAEFVTMRLAAKSGARVVVPSPVCSGADLSVLALLIFEPAPINPEHTTLSACLHPPQGHPTYPSGQNVEVSFCGVGFRINFELSNCSDIRALVLSGPALAEQTLELDLFFPDV